MVESQLSKQYLGTRSAGWMPCCSKVLLLSIVLWVILHPTCLIHLYTFQRASVCVCVCFSYNSNLKHYQSYIRPKRKTPHSIHLRNRFYYSFYFTFVSYFTLGVIYFIVVFSPLNSLFFYSSIKISLPNLQIFKEIER